MSKSGTVGRWNKKQRKERRARLEINVQELDQILDKAKELPLTDDESNKVKTAVHAMAERLMSSGRTTEKASALLGKDEASNSIPGVDQQAKPTTSENDSPEQETVKKPRPGHGRNGAEVYAGPTTEVLHTELCPRDTCPDCEQGKVYPLSSPKILLRIVGMAPFQASKWELQRLRCNLCGEIFTADAPDGIGDDKYDASVASMVALLHYGSGMPWYRIEKIQTQLGVPLPDSNQWELCEEAANDVVPVYHEMIRQGAQGNVMYRDDTSARILEEPERPVGQARDRTGLQTTGIVVETVQDKKVALFFTGPKHAGENLSELLEQRVKGLPPPTLMGDAASRNDKLPAGLIAVLCSCLTHGRRQFVDILDNFPDQCRYVIEEIGLVYANDDRARDLGLDGQQRLAFHQEHSAPVLGRLKLWMQTQLDEKLAEKNSGLGKAISYFLKRWDRLTRFLEQPGAPLDSNIVERALKKVVLLRKNSLFYKSQHGADVGDIFLSLIHTCELNGVNAFEYLTELQRHAVDVLSSPSNWLPWNYHLQLRPPPD